MNLNRHLSLSIFAALWLAAGTLLARPSGETRRIACAPSEPDTAAAIVNHHLWTTIDGGLSWRASLGLDPQRGSLMPEEPDEPDEPADQETLEENVPLPSSESLAISDEACFAFSTGAGILLGCHRARPRRVLALERIRDLAFDILGDLWVITEDGLVLFRDPFGESVRREFWHLTAPFDLVQGPGGRIIALDRNGITRIRVGEADAGPRARLNISGITAAAFETAPAASGRGVLLVAAYGKLTRWIDDEPAVAMGEVPRSTIALLVDRRGEVRFLVGKKWREGRGAFRPVRGLARAVDAAGRFWRGTDDGPVGPGHEASPEAWTPTRVRFGPIPTMKSPLPRPPKCRRLELSPLPHITAVMGYHTGLDRFRGRDPSADRGTLRREVFVGVTLDWRWRRRDPTSCLKRFEAYHIEIAQWNERHAFLASGLARHLTRRVEPSDVRAAIAERVEQDRLFHLVGRAPRGEIEKEIP